jgi:hypothetical protein
LPKGAHNPNRTRGRPRTFTPQEAAARDRQSKADSAKRRAPVFNERRREKRWRDTAHQRRHEGHDQIDGAVSIVTLRNLRKPDLAYIDPKGHVHYERELSAEELIRRYLKKEDLNP